MFPIEMQIRLSAAVAVVWRVTITASTVVWPYLGQPPPHRHAPRHAPLREDGLGNFGKQLIGGNNRLKVVFVP